MSAIKISWGMKIGMLYGGFVLLIATLVTASMRQKYDLVSDDYYAQELQYQHVIDAGKNQSSLSSPVVITTVDEQLLIQFPEEFRQKDISGSVQFYSPVNNSWDQTFSIKADNNQMSISRDSLHPTRYVVKLRWTSEEKNYYQESSLNLYKK